MPSVTQRMPFTLHENLIAASNCNSCCSLPSAQQSLLYLISFRIPTRLIGGSVFRFHGVRNLQAALYFSLDVHFRTWYRNQSDERSRSDAVQRVHGGQNAVVCECVFNQGDGDELCCACEE